MKKIKQNLSKLQSKFSKLKIHFTNSRLLTFAMFFSILWLLLELEARIYDFYFTTPWIDIPSHLLAGVALAAFVMWLIYQSSYIKRKNLVTVYWVFFISMLFEYGEVVEQMIFPSQPLYLWDFFWWDGFWDVIVTVLGGIVFLILFKYKLKKMLKVV